VGKQITKQMKKRQEPILKEEEILPYVISRVKAAKQREHKKVEKEVAAQNQSI